MEKKYDSVIIGLGYIGLPTAAFIASKGLNVLGVDVNSSVVNTINSGKIHIVEPDLDGLVYHVVKEKKLTASVSPAYADTYVIAVPTPFKGGHEPDISFVLAAGEAICPYISKGSLVILESTSPVGTTEKLKALIESKRPELKGEFYLAYCPERVLPGNIIHELEHNDRVIGGIDDQSTEKAISFYAKAVKGTLHATNARTAEMCKLVENSFRDVNIAFANELSMICGKADVNVWELIALANRHPRVNILQPGCGVGGHCIAVDPWFLVHDFREEACMIRTAREVNDYKTVWVIENIKNAALRFELDHKRKPIVACLGLAFKSDIDDLRESPAVEIVRELQKEAWELKIVEPNISSHQEFILSSPLDAVNDADIIAILVAHREFKQLKLGKDKVILSFIGNIK